MDVAFTHGAGLDVHQKTVTACRVTPDPSGQRADGILELRVFGTMTADLPALSDWLAEVGIKHAAMESTGKYWRPVYNFLEGHVTIFLVNAAHVKQVPGRKRHILVDTLGLILMGVVTAARVRDRDGAKSVLAVLRRKFSRLRHIWADAAYAGPLVDWVRALRPQRPIRLEITKRSDRVKGFVVLPQRWSVERTLGWFHRYRRLSKDDEYLTDTSEAMLRVAMIHLMVRRLARIAPY